jgi:hypothetical protein
MPKDRGDSQMKAFILATLLLFSFKQNGMPHRDVLDHAATFKKKVLLLLSRRK